MKLDLTTVAGIFTIIGALAGIIFGIYKLVSSHREKKRQIKVKFSLAIARGGLTPSTWGFDIIALNPGNRRVTLVQPGIILPNKEGELVYFWSRPKGSVNFPHDLSEGQNCHTWMEGKEVIQALRNKGFSGKVKLRGFYRDALGIIHKSKSFKFDIEGFDQLKPR